MRGLGLAISMLSILSLVSAKECAAASGFATVHSFGLTPDDAALPQTGLTISGETLFGTSAFGGRPASNGAGTIYTFDSASGAVSVEYSFGNGPSFPGRLVAAQGALYGTTASGGGANGYIFKYDPHAHAFTLLHAFAGGLDGWSPTPELTFLNGYLYGMTSRGGLANCPFLGTDTCGTVFKIDPAAGRYRQIHAFKDMQDGMAPSTGLRRYQQDLYGATSTTLIRLDSKSGEISAIHRFTNPDNEGSVSGNLVALGGMLYGVNFTGGTESDGALFALDPATGVYGVLHSFKGQAYGLHPSGSLAVHNGVLYGSTQTGGQNNKGVVFSFEPSTRHLQVLHDFTGADGAMPNGGLVFFHGAFYGTTQQGGAANLGVIYRLTP